MSYFAINNKKEVSLMEWKEEIAKMVRKLLLDAVRKVPSRCDGFRCVRARWWGPSWGRHWGCWNCWCPQNRSAASLQRGSNCGGLYTRCPLGWAVQRMESSPKVPYRTCRRTKMPLGPKKIKFKKIIVKTCFQLISQDKRKILDFLSCRLMRAVNSILSSVRANNKEKK